MVTGGSLRYRCAAESTRSRCRRTSSLRSSWASAGAARPPSTTQSRSFAISGLDGELVDRARAVLLSRTQRGRREARLVRRVGKMLCLHREAVAMTVDDAILPPQRAIEEVAGIELEPRLRRVDLHYPAARRLVDPRCKRRAGVGTLVQHEVVIIAPPVAQRSEERRVGKERRSRWWGELRKKKTSKS